MVDRRQMTQLLPLRPRLWKRPQGKGSHLSMTAAVWAPHCRRAETKSQKLAARIGSYPLPETRSPRIAPWRPRLWKRPQEKGSHLSWTAAVWAPLCRWAETKSQKLAARIGSYPLPGNQSPRIAPWLPVSFAAGAHPELTGRHCSVIAHAQGRWLRG